MSGRFCYWKGVVMRVMKIIIRMYSWSSLFVCGVPQEAVTREVE